MSQAKIFDFYKGEPPEPIKDESDADYEIRKEKALKKIDVFVGLTWVRLDYESRAKGK